MAMLRVLTLKGCDHRKTAQGGYPDPSRGVIGGGGCRSAQPEWSPLPALVVSAACAAAHERAPPPDRIWARLAPGGNAWAQFFGLASARSRVGVPRRSGVRGHAGNRSPITGMPPSVRLASLFRLDRDELTSRAPPGGAPHVTYL